MSSEYETYIEKIQARHNKESTLAAALVWRMSDGTSKVEVSIDDIIQVFVSSGLKSRVNKTRLERNLGKEEGILRGTKRGCFRCSLASLEELSSKFSIEEEHTTARVSYRFLEAETFPSNRSYLIKMCDQINGTYQFKFFDGCAVLMRRLMESMLIEVFEEIGESHLIKNSDGSYKMLNGIISALGGSSIRLSRGVDKIIEKVKKVGDNAAHGRTHITKKNDIDDLKIDYRKLVSELKAKANIT